MGIIPPRLSPQDRRGFFIPKKKQPTIATRYITSPTPTVSHKNNPPDVPNFQKRGKSNYPKSPAPPDGVAGIFYSQTRVNGRLGLALAKFQTLPKVLP